VSGLFIEGGGCGGNMAISFFLLSIQNYQT
jgi:hypothetical protein